jgi:Raf kinase inhibitor-like YbhB/YbcL family protein
MNVTSKTFTNNGTIPDSAVFNGMGLTGGNRSPQFTFEGVPEGTQSFAVICHDPDAPTSGGFYHWVMFDIPGKTRELSEGAGSPESARSLGAVLGHTDYGQKQYGGPCPPPGPAHHYHFTVYALKVPKLGLDQNATGALTEFVTMEHTLAKSTIIGTFARPS